MAKIGIFFGTDTGTTRLIAKKMAKILGDAASKPLNVNRISVDDMLQYDSLILGTPSYGEGQLPGISTGVKAGSWEEFLPQLDGVDLTGKRIALYGLGNQDKYADRFANSLFALYEKLTSLGADIIGAWPVNGYTFEHSKSVVDGQFVGLILDQNNQAMLTEERITTWLAQVSPALLEKMTASAAQAV
jgi:flavodoxin I